VLEPGRHHIGGQPLPQFVAQNPYVDFAFETCDDKGNELFDVIIVRKTTAACATPLTSVSLVSISPSSTRNRAPSLIVDPAVEGDFAVRVDQDGVARPVQNRVRHSLE